MNAFLRHARTVRAVWTRMKIGRLLSICTDAYVWWVTAAIVANLMGGTHAQKGRMTAIQIMQIAFTSKIRVTRHIHVNVGLVSKRRMMPGCA
jgi:hypothetical protein